MAAKDPEKSKCYYDDLQKMLQEAVNDGVVSAGGTVTTAITALQSERDSH